VFVHSYLLAQSASKKQDALTMGLWSHPTNSWERIPKTLFLCGLARFGLIDRLRSAVVSGYELAAVCAPFGNAFHHRLDHSLSPGVRQTIHDILDHGKSARGWLRKFVWVE